MSSIAPTGRARGRIAARRQWLHTHPRHRTFLLLTCLLGMFATTFPATILAVSVKRIADDLNSTASTVVWATTAPMLAGAVAMPILGRIGDLRGHRRVYLGGFTVSIAFAALTAVAWDATSLIGFRTISQLAGTATVPASLSMLYRAFPPAERVKVSGWGSSVLAGAAVSGLVIGGPLTEMFGWRLIFVLQGLIAVAALVPALFVLRPGDEELADGDIDWLGAALLAVTAFTITFSVNRLPVWGPTPLVLALLVAFPLALAAFVAVERRAPTPILPLGLLQKRQLRLALVVSFVVCAGWFGAFLVAPLLMQSVIGLSIAASSIASFPRATFISLAGTMSGRVGLRYGERRMLVIALGGLAASMGLLAGASVLRSIVVVIIGISTGGFAFGLVQPALMSLVSGGVDEGDLGVATSLQQTANNIGQVFGGGLLSAVAADASRPGPFVIAFAGSAGFVLLAMGIATRIRRVRPAAVPAAVPSPALPTPVVTSPVAAAPATSAVALADEVALDGEGDHDVEDEHAGAPAANGGTAVPLTRRRRVPRRPTRRTVATAGPRALDEDGDEAGADDDEQTSWAGRAASGC